MHPFVLVLGIGTIIGNIGLSSGALAAGSATIVLLRGKAKTGDGQPLSEKQKVAPGTTVITEAGAFVKLLFPDNTQLNVGPNTTMKIENTPAGAASLVDLVGGQIRAKVTKDLLQKNGDGVTKEKMVIKTKTAAMGIRGTDFNVSFNRENNLTALITFEGSVAMARLEPGASPLAALLQNSGVQSVGAGQFSGAQPDMPQASIPVKISPAQLESMKGNSTFETGKAEKQSAMSSPVPPGIDPKSFSSGSEKAMGESVAKTVGEANLSSAIKESSKGETVAVPTAPPEGFLNKSTGEYAPRAGGFIDLASGRYVPPPPGSAFDPNTGVFTPPRAMGQFDAATGAYVPPKGIELDAVKGFIAETPRTPATADGQTTQASASTEALANAMNIAAKPENAGTTVTADASFTFNADGSMNAPAADTSPASAAPEGAQDQTDEPEDEIPIIPEVTIQPNTNVDFSISVTN